MKTFKEVSVDTLKMVEVMQGYAQGKEVMRRDKYASNLNSWVICHKPIWDWHTSEYELKENLLHKSYVFKKAYLEIDTNLIYVETDINPVDSEDNIVYSRRELSDIGYEIDIAELSPTEIHSSNFINLDKCKFYWEYKNRCMDDWTLYSKTRCNVKKLQEENIFLSVYKIRPILDLNYALER